MVFRQSAVPRPRVLELSPPGCKGPSGQAPGALPVPAPPCSSVTACRPGPLRPCVSAAVPASAEAVGSVISARIFLVPACRRHPLAPPPRPESGRNLGLLLRPGGISEGLVGRRGSITFRADRYCTLVHPASHALFLTRPVGRSRIVSGPILPSGLCVRCLRAVASNCAPHSPEPQPAHRNIDRAHPCPTNSQAELFLTDCL